jgi:hypothetical protein
VSLSLTSTRGSGLTGIGTRLESGRLKGRAGSNPASPTYPIQFANTSNHSHHSPKYSASCQDLPMESWYIRRFPADLRIARRVRSAIRMSRFAPLW